MTRRAVRDAELRFEEQEDRIESLMEERDALAAKYQRADELNQILVPESERLRGDLDKARDENVRLLGEFHESTLTFKAQCATLTEEFAKRGAAQSEETERLRGDLVQARDENAASTLMRAALAAEAERLRGDLVHAREENAQLQEAERIRAALAEKLYQRSTALSEEMERLRAAASPLADDKTLLMSVLVETIEDSKNMQKEIAALQLDLLEMRDQLEELPPRQPDAPLPDEAPPLLNLPLPDEGPAAEFEASPPPSPPQPPRSAKRARPWQQDDDEENNEDVCFFKVKFGHLPNHKKCGGPLIEHFLRDCRKMTLCAAHTCSRRAEGCWVITRKPYGTLCGRCIRSLAGQQRKRERDARRMQARRQPLPAPPPREEEEESSAATSDLLQQ
jgi:hypothetical protein